MYTHPDARILIFARPPVPGRCKSRLAAGVGKPNAARIYRDMLHRIVARCVAAQLAPVELWCSENPRHPALLQCRSRYGVTLRQQARGDLGRKMQHALYCSLKQASHAVIIGSDCPALLPPDINQALNMLQSGHPRQQVLVPADDGGYVLVGSRAVEPGLFRNIAWGETSVLATTRRRAQRHGLKLIETEPLWDVDTAADWRRARDAGLV